MSLSVCSWSSTMANRDLRVLERIDQFICNRILIERHRNAAQALRGRHRPIEAGAVLSDDRQCVATFEAERCKGHPRAARPANERRAMSMSAKYPNLFSRMAAFAAHAGMEREQARGNVVEFPLAAAPKRPCADASSRSCAIPAPKEPDQAASEPGV